MPTTKKVISAKVKSGKKKTVTSGNEVTPESVKREDSGQAAIPQVGTRMTTNSKAGKLSAAVYSVAGVKGADFELPKEIFGATVNEKLLAQALRVYSSNIKGHFSNTKTRGEVEGSTAKMGPQKGSGRARHGSKRAPIYRGGGIALGPKSRKIMLDLPKKMKKAALISALSQKAKESEVEVVTGLDKASGKTKEMAILVKKLGKKSILFVTEDKKDSVVRAVNNLEKVGVLSAEGLNVYEVIKFQTVVLSKEAVGKLEERLLKKGEKSA